MLAPNEIYERSRADGRLPSFLGNEGPTHPGDFLSPRGHVRALLLLLDFADLPADRDAAAVAPSFFPDTKYFEEVSYGRFSVSVEALGSWVRLPRPSAAYLPMGERLLAYVGDAVAAADPVVDFSRYQVVFLVPTNKLLAGTTAQALVRYPGRGFVADGVELRFFATMQADAVARYGRGAAYSMNHEFLHTLGFPDTRNSPEQSGAWDPMGPGAGGGPPSSTHLLGWHKWKVGWLDPEQLTCLSAPGSVDETITRLAAPGGKKLVVVPLSNTTAYVVEARTRLGYDRAICEEGVLVYTVDSRPVFAGEYVDGNGVVNLKGPKRCEQFVAGAFRPGQTYEDASVKVEVLARDAVAYRVRVTRK